MVLYIVAKMEEREHQLEIFGGIIIVIVIVIVTVVAVIVLATGFQVNKSFLF